LKALPVNSLKSGLFSLSRFSALLEVVSKCHIAFESKAQADEKAQHTFKYVSILKRSATQLSDARWGFETTSKKAAIFIHFPKPSEHAWIDQISLRWAH
jgi:hypothetical protein